MMPVLVHETDWLGSHPVFYNENTGAVSHSINDVIDPGKCEFDGEGLRNYLDFGYSVLERTPVKGVRFLGHSSRLLRGDDGRLSVERLADPVDPLLSIRTTEAEVIELLRAKVREWENSFSGPIILPTSGGYDSRLLNLLVTDRSRVRSFTYGLSDQQEASFEVVHARAIAARLGIMWQSVPLGAFHQYVCDWDHLFGVSVHAHGMYQMEFYRKIADMVGPGHHILSGIIGDAWAGSVDIPDICDASDVMRLGYTHGMHANSNRCRLAGTGDAISDYYRDHQERLQDPRVRVIEAMRFKMMLLSYLFRVPEAMGFVPWSPFLDIHVAVAMLNLPQERRRNRIWQKELFASAGLDVESWPLTRNYQNNLNFQAMRQYPLDPLDATLLGNVMERDYIRWVNRHVARHGRSWQWLWRQGQLRPRRVGRVLGMVDMNDRWLEAYLAYLTLWPLQQLCARCAAKRRHGPTAGCSRQMGE